MSSTVKWSFQGIASERMLLLATPLDFSALTRQIANELHNVRYKKDKGTHEAKGSWRPVVWFDVQEPTFDRFFNSPSGYRGQFLQAAQVGQDANSSLVEALARSLSINSDISELRDEQTCESLASPHAKIWIDEYHHRPQAPKLVVEIVVPTWVAAATQIHDRLVRADSTLTQKEIDRIYGVRAPRGCTLKLMGAWIGPTGELIVVPSKLRRAQDIHEFGVS